MNQYGPENEGDLGPWNESIVECWTGRNLAQLWIRFQLPGDPAVGWLLLEPTETSSDQRFEEKPTDVPFDLRAEPAPSAPVVATLRHADLQNAADRLRLHLPRDLETTAVPEDGSFHLAGCWQEQPTDDGLGLHFYWTPDG